MSSGEVHHKYYLRGYKYVIPASLIICLLEWKFGMGYLVGYTLGRYIDPDLDLMGTTAAEGRQVNELPVLGHILYGISSAYGSIFRKRHRSWMTHLPLISTMGRLIFFFGLFFVWGDGHAINFIGGGWIWFWLSLWLGLSHADGIHYYHDKHETKE